MNRYKLIGVWEPPPERVEQIRDEIKAELGADAPDDEVEEVLREELIAIFVYEWRASGVTLEVESDE